MARPTAPPPSTNGKKSGHLSDDLLAHFHNRFVCYRIAKERARLLAGILPDSNHRKMTVLNAVILICFIAAAREWRTSPWRKMRYRDARWRSEYAETRRIRFYDVTTVRKQTTVWDINRMEALLALHFSLRAGYPTHSRALWKCIEGAICTDGLGDPPRVVRSRDDVDELFAAIRLRLYHLRKSQSAAALAAEAQGIYQELLSKLRDKNLKVPKDELLMKAAHQEA